MNDGDLRYLKSLAKRYPTIASAATDTGKEMKEGVKDLEELLTAYRTGLIVENSQDFTY